MGKYCCLLCAKEFSSESGVKYHILKAHAEVGRAGLWVGQRRDPGAGWSPAEGLGRRQAVVGGVAALSDLVISGRLQLPCESREA